MHPESPSQRGEFPKIRDTGADMQAFADDIVVYKVKNKTQKLEDELGPAMRVLEEWGQKWLINFCPEKTKCMTFSWLRNTSNDSICLENRELENVTNYKYLGLVFNRRLTWKSHLKYVTSKASRLLSKVAPNCKSNWGLPSDATKFIYERAILPILLYGAIVWGKIIDQSTVQKELQKVQRLAALSITGAAKTVANDSLNVLAGLKPLHLVIAERAAMQLHSIYANPDLKDKLDIESFLEEHKRSPQHESSLQKADNLLSEAVVNKNNITEMTKLTSQDHPGKIFNPQVSITDTPEDFPKEDIILYTDASKAGEENPVGVAVVTKRGESFETIFECSLEANSSVFSGELRAIEEATRFANENLRENQSARIRSDSLSSLLAIQDLDNRDKRIFTLRKVMQNMLDTRNIRVKLEWVKAHIGLDGNEAADLAAKAAMRNVPETNDKLTKMQVKHTLRRITTAEWQTEWHTANTGRFTYTIFPTVSPEPRFQNIQQTRDKKLLFKASSGHFPTNDYRKRFNKRNDDKCPYCTSQDSVTHFITECNRFASIRHFHKTGIERCPNMNLKNMLLNERLQQLTLKILKLRIKQPNQ